MSRAAFLLSSTDGRHRPAEFEGQILAAFDELTATTAAAASSSSATAGVESNLLGSLLLPRPAPARSSPLTAVRIATSLGATSVGKKGDGASCDVGVEPTDWQSLLQRLLGGIEGGGDLAARDPVPTMHPDLIRTIVQTLLDEATSATSHADESAAAGPPAAASRSAASSTGLLSFSAFRAGVRDCLRLRALHSDLKGVLVELQPSTGPSSSHAKSTSALPAGEVIELLRTLARRSSAAADSSLTVDQLRGILSDLRLSPQSFHPAASIPIDELTRAVVAAHLRTMVDHRRAARASADERTRAFLARQECDVSSAVSSSSSWWTPAASPGDAAAPVVHTNPARTSALTPYEDVDTVEYS